MPPTGPFPTGAGGHQTGIDVLTLWDDVGSAREEPGPATYLPKPSEVIVVFPMAGAAYQAVVTDASGAVVEWTDLAYDAHNEMSAFGVVGTDPGRLDLEGEVGPGAYRLALTANGHEIGGVDFVVRTVGGDDPFDPRPTVIKEVADRQIAALSYTVDPDEGSGGTAALHVHFWRPPAAPGSDGTEYTVSLKRGSETIDDGTVRMRLAYPALHAFRFRPDIIENGARRGSRDLRPEDLADGEYRVEVAEEGRPPIVVYRFRIEDGEPVAHPRSALDTPRRDFLLPMSSPASVAGDRWATRFAPAHRVWLESDR
jgi:hypothetical protein